MKVELEWHERQRIAEWAQNEIKEIGRTIFYDDDHDAKLTANEILKKVSDED